MQIIVKTFALSCILAISAAAAEDVAPSEPIKFVPHRVGTFRSEACCVGDFNNDGKPDIAAGLARRWYDVDGVTAIADLTNSAVALGVAGIAKEKQKIALYNGPATTRPVPGA